MVNFAETAAISAGKSDSQLLTSYFDGVVDRFVDQMTHRVAGREWGSIPDVQAMWLEVTQQAEQRGCSWTKMLAANANFPEGESRASA